MESAQNAIRLERDKALKKSDWIQFAIDTFDEETKQAWLDYRQELRDAPQKYAADPTFENTFLPLPPDYKEPEDIIEFPENEQEQEQTEDNG